MVRNHPGSPIKCLATKPKGKSFVPRPVSGFPLLFRGRRGFAVLSNGSKAIIRSSDSVVTHEMRRLNVRWAKNIMGGLAGFATVFAVLATAASAPAQDTGPAANVAEALRSGTPRIAEQLANDALHGQSLSPLMRAHILMNRGLAREQMGQRHAALGDFNIALAMSVLRGDDLARAYFDRGVTRDELGETNKAIADYSAALKLVPTLSAALNNGPMPFAVWAGWQRPNAAIWPR